jgi:uncharacterized membrane protein
MGHPDRRRYEDEGGDAMQDPMWIRGLLGVHVAAGTVSFVMAPVALATAKGGRAHRRWGKVYFWAMVVVAATALVLSLYRPILFLALVAVFSFYAAFSAYRVLGQKAAVKGEAHVAAADWAAAAITFTTSLGLAACGLLRPALVQGLGIPAVIFGLIGMRLGAKDMWRFIHPPKEKLFWWYEHLQGMMASYIAAWTAFLVVTVGQFVHAWWLWIVPTAIGVPAITLTTAYYKRKFLPKVKMAA